jgi:hypothetical protein
LNGTGGTEKICCVLANNFVKSGHLVVIATNENISGTAMFPLVDQVKVTNIFDANIDQKELIPIYNYRGKNPFLWLYYKIISENTTDFFSSASPVQKIQMLD